MNAFPNYLKRHFQLNTRHGAKKHGYKFSKQKALEIYSAAKEHIGLMPKNNTTKLLIQQAVAQLKAVSSTLAALKFEMESLASSLPEYPVVMCRCLVSDLRLAHNLSLKLAMCADSILKRPWLPLRELMLRRINLAK